jgi:D-cysteine desulfhydrase
VKAPTSQAADAGLWPILERFPGLAGWPRASIRDRISPVEPLDEASQRLWVKRDDLNAPRFGGNKVRALEWLLGGMASGECLATVGARGSTHALTTAIWGNAFGARTTVGLWPQEMNDVAYRVSHLLYRAAVVRRLPNPPTALAWLWWRGIRGDRLVPAGGTSPLGILGHVNAALELSRQVESGECPRPTAVVVPLGTGGTMAGLALGFAIARMDTTVVGARVVPRIVGRIGRVRRLAEATRQLIERKDGSTIAEPLAPLAVVHDVYGGAYGRPLERATRLAAGASDRSIGLDPAYSAKALTAAVELRAGGPILFWMTFDSRWLSTGTDADG